MYFDLRSVVDAERLELMTFAKHPSGVAQHPVGLYNNPEGSRSIS